MANWFFKERCQSFRQQRGPAATFNDHGTTFTLSRRTARAGNSHTHGHGLVKAGGSKPTAFTGDRRDLPEHGHGESRQRQHRPGRTAFREWLRRPPRQPEQPWRSAANPDRVRPGNGRPVSPRSRVLFDGVPASASKPASSLEVMEGRDLGTQPQAGLLQQICLPREPWRLEATNRPVPKSNFRNLPSGWWGGQNLSIHRALLPPYVLFYVNTLFRPFEHPNSLPPQRPCTSRQVRSDPHPARSVGPRHRSRSSERPGLVSFFNQFAAAGASMPAKRRGRTTGPLRPGPAQGLRVRVIVHTGSRGGAGQGRHRP